jgi:hypothetical protein
MNDSPTTLDKDFWSHILLMIALAVAIFASLEYIPSILDNAAGAIASVAVGGFFLYYFGKHTGALLADAD